jgi:hypothetical protein
MARIIEGMLSAVDGMFEKGLYLETLDLRRVFVDPKGNAKVGFYVFTPNVNEILTLGQVRARYQIPDLEQYNTEYEMLYESPTEQPIIKKPYVVSQSISYCLGLAFLEMASLDNRFLYRTT